MRKIDHARRLKTIVRVFQLTQDEVATFLKLSDSGRGKLAKAYADLSKLELDNTGWHEKVAIVYEIYDRLRHTENKTEAEIRRLLRSHAEEKEFEPFSNRAVLIRGGVSDAIRIRDRLAPALN